MVKSHHLKAGAYAIWEKPVSGNKFAPFNDPVANIGAIYFHSDLNYYTVLMSGTAALTHPAIVAAGSVPVGEGTAMVVLGGVGEVDQVIVTHNLGYVPRFMVSFGGAVLSNGAAVQVVTASGRSNARIACAYATTTQLILWTKGFSTNNSLPAITNTYSYLILKRLMADPSLPLCHITPARTIFGRGKFDSNLRTIRLALLGDTSPFWLSKGPNVGIFGGRTRFISGAGVVTDERGYFGPLIPPASTRIAPR